MLIARLPDMRTVLTAAILFAAATTCRAADFGLSATIRAGLRNSGDWELGIGPSGNNTLHTANLAPYYPDNEARRFELGYSSATNEAFLRYYHDASTFQQATFAPGGSGLGAGSVWIIPVGSLFVSSASRPSATSIAVDQLALSGGVEVLQGLSSTSLTAAHTGSTVVASLADPVLFRTGASGDWLLSGRISFSGLSAYQPSGAQRSQLQLIANVSGTSVQTPEPPASGLFALGLFGVGLLAGRRRIAGGTH